jgi:hypothetical protein
MMKAEDFESMHELSHMLYQIHIIKADTVKEFIDANLTNSMDKVFKLIVILMRDHYNIKELVNLALHYKDTFSVNLDEIFSSEDEFDDDTNSAIYFGNILIREGIPKEALKTIHQSKLTGEEYESKTRSEPLLAIKKDDSDRFLKAVGGAVNSPAPKLGGKIPMTYLSWAALFRSSNVFIFLSTKIKIKDETIKIAIRKGNRKILQKIFATEDLHKYIDYLIKHHRNYIFDQVKKVSDINNEALLKVAADNMNFYAYAALSAKSA